MQCEACESWFPLPDWVARRREHLTEGRAFTCARAGRGCGAGCGWDDARDTFAEEVLAAFAPLLEHPQRLIASMAPCGAPPALGDALLALPTLVHRGPGCEEPQGGDERQVPACWPLPASSLGSSTRSYCPRIQAATPRAQAATSRAYRFRAQVLHRLQRVSRPLLF